MWIAVASLSALAVASAVSAVAEVSNLRGGGLQPSPTLVMRLIEASDYAQMLLVPVAALSLAAYVLLLDRQVSGGLRSRGFDVEAARPRGDA
jgi:hypothetical protein